MGRMPFAGMAWQVLHYLEGFRRLGYDVYYVEDTSDWPYNPERNAVSEDCAYAVAFIKKVMEWLGMPDRWVYRFSPAKRTFGLSESQTVKLFNSTDILVNLCGGTVLRDYCLDVPVRIYLETDPVRPQIEIAQGRQSTIELLAAHTHHFTYGENLVLPDSSIPVNGFKYRTTRPPVVLDWWSPNGEQPASSVDSFFTTIGNWEQTGKNIEWNGQTYYWSKHLEFLKFIELPHRTKQPLQLALVCDAETTTLLKSNGWSVTDALALTKSIVPYRSYIMSSRGEFTVAKSQYVLPRSGWFSDRSVCYLAAARPVITQETGFSRFLPSGKGLFGFDTMDDILSALDNVAGDYEVHCEAARELATEYFAAEKVLGKMMDHIGQ
jgi:hypothetical protein